MARTENEEKKLNNANYNRIVNNIKFLTNSCCDDLYLSEARKLINSNFIDILKEQLNTKKFNNIKDYIKDHFKI